MGNPYGMSDQMLWDAVEERGELRSENERLQGRIQELERQNTRHLEDNRSLRGEVDRLKVEVDGYKVNELETTGKINELKEDLRNARSSDPARAMAHLIPEGYFLAPMEPDEGMWTAGRDPIHFRDTNFYRFQGMEIPAWQTNPDGTVEKDKSKGTTAVHTWRAQRDDWLQRYPMFKGKAS